MKSYWIVILGTIILGGSACSTGSTEDNAKPKVSEKEFVAQNARFSISREEPIVDQLILNGQVEPDPNRVVAIFPQLSGYATSVNAHFGDYVTKGQTLAVLQGGEIEELLYEQEQARNELAVSKKELEVTRDLYASGFTSEAELLASEQGVRTLKANLARLDKVIKLYNVSEKGEQVIVAPVSGYVVEQQVAAGTFVRADEGEQIFTISSLDEVWITANIYQSDISRVKSGSPVEVTSLAHEGLTFNGKVDRISNVIDPESRTLKLVVKFNNSDRLFVPGMFVDVRVVNQQEQKAITVPDEAIVFDNNQNYVITGSGEGDFKVLPVEIIKKVNGKTYIREGLSAGQQVVVGYPLLFFEKVREARS